MLQTNINSQTTTSSIKEALGYTRPKKIPGKLALSLAAGCLILAAFGFGERFISSPSTYVSPIATEESIVKKIQPDIVKRTTDQYPPSVYFPTLLTPKFDEQLEDVSSLAYAAMDRDSRELLLAKNLTLRRPIASIVKVMTALVAIDNIDLSSEYMVTEEATKAGEAVMGLTAGERLTLQELLYGILLPSGNDAAETIAQGPLAGGAAARTTFISRMNEKARNLGMLDSHFVNPTGLDEDKVANSTFSTALDLLALGNYSLNNDMVAKIVGTRTMVLPYKKNYHKAFFLSNILGLRQSYPGVAGIKPGNTDFAKETLLSYAENRGKRIILVLLGSERTRDDAVKIYDYLFGKIGITVKK